MSQSETSGSRTRRRPRTGLRPEVPFARSARRAGQAEETVELPAPPAPAGVGGPTRRPGWYTRYRAAGALVSRGPPRPPPPPPPGRRGPGGPRRHDLIVVHEAISVARSGPADVVLSRRWGRSPSRRAYPLRRFLAEHASRAAGAAVAASLRRAIGIVTGVSQASSQPKVRRGSAAGDVIGRVARNARNAGRLISSTANGTVSASPVTSGPAGEGAISAWAISASATGGVGERASPAAGREEQLKPFAATAGYRDAVRPRTAAAARLRGRHRAGSLSRGRVDDVLKAVRRPRACAGSRGTRDSVRQAGVYWRSGGTVDVEPDH